MSPLPRLLIVDSSRVVRASLAKKLRAQYEIREEANGESAWQTLVLDASIVGVVSGLALPKLDAWGLIERLRENQLVRLHQMPFFLVTSDSMSSELRAQAFAAGVSGFMPKGLGAAEYSRILAAPLKITQTATDDSTEFTRSDLALAGASDDDGAQKPVVGEAAKAPTLFSKVESIERIDHLLASDRRQHGIGVLVFELDGYTGLVARFGKKMAERIEARFALLLSGKLRVEDSIGRISAERLVIVANNTSHALCMAFAGRICKRMEEARVAVVGELISMTVSVGVASFSEKDRVSDGATLLALAESRLNQASMGGGNRVVGQLPEKPEAGALIKQLGELLCDESTKPSPQQLRQLGMLMLPLLEEIARSFDVALPLVEMKKKLLKLSETDLNETGASLA